MVASFVKYCRQLSVGRIVLWCYLVWYLCVVAYYFDPNPRIWMNSLGISVIIGFALILSVKPSGPGAKLDKWQIGRLFLMPFCVSSFSSLIKGEHFFLIFPPRLNQLATPVVICAVILSGIFFLKKMSRRPNQPRGENKNRSIRFPRAGSKADGR